MIAPPTRPRPPRLDRRIPQQWTAAARLCRHHGRREDVSAINSSGAATSGQDVWIVDAYYGWSPSTPRIPGAYDEEVTSWARTCTSSCTPGGRWSSITLSQRQESNRLRVSGGLMPGRPGAKIKVKVQRRQGKKWVTVRRSVTRTSSISTYQVLVKRPAYGSCRVLVAWAGSKAHRKATARTGQIIC